MNINRIIVPVDFTENAENGLNYAIPLARKLKAHVLLLHSYTVNYAPNAGATMSTMPHPTEMDVVSLKKMNVHKLQKFMENFPQLSTIDHTYMTALGSPVEAICTTAKDEKADLIIMGTDGASQLEGFFIGTISEKVSRKSPCPVLVVPSTHAPMQIDNIGLALDTEPMDIPKGLDVLKAIGKATGANLRIIHIAEEDGVAFKKEDVTTFYKKALQELQPSFHVFRNEDPKEGISEFLENSPIALLVLAYREHGFFERLFQPGVLRKVLFETHLPTLILK